MNPTNAASQAVINALADLASWAAIHRATIQATADGTLSLEVIAKDGLSMTPHQTPIGRSITSGELDARVQLMIAQTNSHPLQTNPIDPAKLQAFANHLEANSLTMAVIRDNEGQYQIVLTDLNDPYQPRAAILGHRVNPQSIRSL